MKMEKFEDDNEINNKEEGDKILYKYVWEKINQRNFTGTFYLLVSKFEVTGVKISQIWARLCCFGIITQI